MTEIQQLAAETLAIQTVLAHILEELVHDEPRLRESVRKGFDHAASDLEQIAVARSKGGNVLPQVTKALQVIESLRTMSLGNQGKPKHAV